ncbi:AtpZ/AtpI family protein [Nisaea sediminum]|uniref:AtpZ/AtpI family protein n=1 Tax=Nisaea sediminum TaxID=2775867 RepID=UPI001866488B|nr:AtpZ/AtpI family protein [Nisaea sediminum]
MTGEKPSDPPSLDDLDARLRRARGEDQGESGPKGTRGSVATEGLGMAMRIGVELVAGVGVGAGIGYLLDSWLGTAPWLLILFFFLGAAGGMMNVYRAATGEGLQVGYKRSSTNKRSDGQAGDE